MSKTAVLVDLDHTLIDGAEIKRRIFTYVAQKKVPFKVMLRRYELSKRSGFFSPERFIGSLPGFYSIFKKPKAYNYPGAERFLRTLRKNYDLYLVTYGDRRFQLLKVRQSGLGGLFNKIIVTADPEKISAMNKFKREKYEAILVLDDSPAVIRAAEDIGFSGLRIRRTRKDWAYYSGLLPKINRILGSKN